MISATPATLGHRQIYILPTGPGVAYAALLVAMLLGAVNYNNGLAYALTFLLAGIGLVSMVDGHKNLHGVEANVEAGTPVFAGAPAGFRVWLRNPTPRAHRGLALKQGGRVLPAVDVPPREQRCVELSVIAPARGWVPAPRFTLTTRYPLGLLYAWSRAVVPQVRALAYPRPAPPTPWVFTGEAGATADRGRQRTGDDFAGLRGSQAGDSPRHISWKALAQGRGMLTKQFAGEARARVWLDWEATPPGDTEARLSLLCRWVLDAEAAGLRYGLRLPGTTLAPAGGPAHEHRCLKALALFEG